MTKRNEWDDERHDEHVPDKTITTRTSRNSKRTPTGGQKPMEWVGWWMTRWTHSPVMTTWTSQNSKRTPIGGHEPLERPGWQTTQRTCSRCDENPHRRARTSGMSGMTNVFPMRQMCSWCVKHVPDAVNTVPTWWEPPQEGTNLWNEQDDECVPRRDVNNPDFLELEENPHMRARTSRTPLPAHPHPSVNIIWFSTRIFLPYILFGLPRFGVRVQPFCRH